MAQPKQKTEENAREALRLLDEIVSREKTSRSAVFRRLGMIGRASTEIIEGTGCTPQMLERVRTEHARVTRQASAPAVKAGLTVAPREDERDDGEDEEESEEPEDSEEDAEEDAEDSDADELMEAIDDENEGDDRPRRVPARDLDEAPTPRRASRGVVESIVKTPARFGPTVPGKGAPLLAPERSELHRAADVIAALGGIDNAERVVDLVRALKGAA